MSREDRTISVEVLRVAMPEAFRTATLENNCRQAEPTRNLSWDATELEVGALAYSSAKSSTR